MRVFKIFYLNLLLLGLICGSGLHANNLSITNVSVNANLLNFNVSWDNSWRTTSTAPYNYDAVWIFVKYRDCGTLQWSHAEIDSAGAGNPLFADTTADEKGVMLYRATNGTGNIANVNVSLRLFGMPSGNFDFEVFGVEMVYVPQGAFALGDGNGNGFYDYSNSPLPFQIVSEAALLGEGADLSSTIAPVMGLPAVYPKGFRSFYCMKYEISQQQYADFLNTLTSTQATARFPGLLGNYRYTLSGNWPTFTAAAGNRAMNYIDWDDSLAFFDWTALRPMSEMEYEKACRGFANYVPGEYAWGTTVVVDANSVINDGTPTEAVADPIPPGAGIANFNNNVVDGPLRTGFAGSSGTNRLQIGATYFGICEMSGNVLEYTVTTSTIDGVSYVPFHGDGELLPTGYMDVSGWPGGVGSGGRGGAWIWSDYLMATSARYFGGFGNNPGRTQYIGGRGVRY